MKKQIAPMKQYSLLTNPIHMKNYLVIAITLISTLATAQENTFPETGKVGIGTTEPTFDLEVKSQLENLSSNFVQRWSNRESDENDLSLNTIWNNQGINHYFNQKYDGKDYRTLAFYKGNVGIGTLNPTATLELETRVSPRTTHLVQKWGNTETDDANLKLFSRWDQDGINHYFGQRLGGVEYTNLSFYRGKTGIGTITPRADLEIKTPIKPRSSANAQIWSNTGADNNLLFLQTTWDAKYGINYNLVQKHDGTNAISLAFHRGNVGIGTATPDAKLTVGGLVHATGVKVDLSVPGADYVFHNEYTLMTLKDVQDHIAKKGHLPNVPSAIEMETNGIELGTMNMKLLEKIEELTLYAIEQEKKLKEQQAKNENLESRLEKLEAFSDQK